MNMKSSIALFIVAMTLLSSAAFAHHSFAMFDRTKEVELKDATVKEWQWTSPHAWLLIWVPNGTSQPDAYTIESTNPGILRRLGYTKGIMSPGDKVTVYMNPLKSGDKGGSLLAVILPGGRMLGARLAGNESTTP